MSMNLVCNTLTVGFVDEESLGSVTARAQLAESKIVVYGRGNKVLVEGYYFNEATSLYRTRK